MMSEVGRLLSTQSYECCATISFHLQLDQRDDGDEIQKVMGELTGATSVPRVFVGGKFIGASRNVGPG